MVDVGGTKFTTTVATIRHSSYLAGMVDVAAWDDNPQHIAEIFLDRDPDIFAALLRLMRLMPRVVGLIPRDPFICASLIAEADFFGVDALLLHVKAKAFYNSRTRGQERPAHKYSRRLDGETTDVYRQRSKQEFHAHLKADRAVKKAFKKKDEGFAVERFDALYGSVSDALENDVLPKYFLEPRPLSPPPSKKIVQLLPVESATWFLVGDIHDSKYGAPGPEEGDGPDALRNMMRMADAIQQPARVRRVACHALVEDSHGKRKMEPVLHLSPSDYECWMRESDVLPGEAGEGEVAGGQPLVYNATLKDGRLVNEHTGGLAHRTMLAGEWLSYALLERHGYMGVIFEEHYWTHIMVAETPPDEHGFSRADSSGPHPAEFDHSTSEPSDDDDE